MRLFACLLVVAAFAACNTQPAADEGADEETVTIDDDGTPDATGKADAVSAGAVVKGTLRDGDTRTGTLPASTYWAWKVVVTKGQTVTFDVDSTASATRHPVVLAYGPKSGTSWGSRLARKQASASSASASFTAAADGTYLLVVGESARRSYAFQAVLDVAGNACEAASGRCQALTHSGCAAGTHAGDARTYSCGGGLGVMCCLPGAENACTSQGGRCVGLAPGACDPSTGRVGDARTSSCGGPLGVECCLPLCQPYCGAQGSRSEGWYDGCTGGLIGWAKCAGHTATCGAIGSRSEGWYDGSTLIHWADCG